MVCVCLCVCVSILLLCSVFVCLARDVLCDVAWFVFLCVFSVFVLFVLRVFVRFACDV